MQYIDNNTTCNSHDLYIRVCLADFLPKDMRFARMSQD